MKQLVFCLLLSDCHLLQERKFDFGIADRPTGTGNFARELAVNIPPEEIGKICFA